MLIEAIMDDSDGIDSDGRGPSADDQLSLDDLVKPADWPAGKNWGTLSIDASCTPADITYPTDLKLLNEARETTERIIDDLCRQSTGYGLYRPRYDRGKARARFLNVAKQKKPRRRRLKAAVRRQLSYLQRNLEAIDALIADGASLSALKTHWWHKLLACSELHRQQSFLINSNTRSIPHRLVEFRAEARATHCAWQGEGGLRLIRRERISASRCRDGFPFLHRHQLGMRTTRVKYTDCSGGKVGAGQRTAIRTRICADRIHTTTKNKAPPAPGNGNFGCRESGLGRPSKGSADQCGSEATAQWPISAVCNEVEGESLGSGKRKHSLRLYHGQADPWSRNLDLHGLPG